jgi:ribosomal protein S9
MSINDRPLENALVAEDRMIMLSPWSDTGRRQFCIDVNVKGGGSSGQAGAIVAGLRARSCRSIQISLATQKADLLLVTPVLWNEKYRRHKARKHPILKRQDLF